MFSIPQKLAPTWDALAKALEHDTTVTIAKVDCAVHKSICNNFDIKGFPTLLWIEDGKKVSAGFLTSVCNPSSNEAQLLMYVGISHFESYSSYRHFLYCKDLSFFLAR
jgi:thioredoxin-like negative regulator of GroEL